MARDPNKLRVFHLAHGLALRVYKLSLRLPEREKYGLGSQLRKAAFSVPANIVEGCNRTTSREYGRFLEVSIGSAAEVGYLLQVVIDLELLPAADVQQCKIRSEEVLKTLQNVHRTVVAWK
jgi:four helix bundle protein